MNVVKISAAEVNKLRKQTGAGMMDCKKALKEANGDFEAAIEYLRKKGQKVAAKRADRTASEGAAIAKSNEAGTKGIVIVLSCETDFVAKNSNFIQLANDIADLALANFPATKEELLQLELDGLPLNERITQEIGKIGEKIEVSNYEHLTNEVVVPYIHAGNRIGVLVALNQAKNDAIWSAGKDLAMQVAAMSPIAVSEADVPAATIAQELKIGREQAIEMGKPEQMVERIAQGKLKKFYKDNTLVHQQFVKDTSKNIKQFLIEIDSKLEVVDFKRVAIG